VDEPRGIGRPAGRAAAFLGSAEASAARPWALGGASDSPAARGRGAREGGGESASRIASRRAALEALNDDGVPYVVGGAYAMRVYTGIYRDTKDLDLCCTREAVEPALASLARARFRIERTDALWLAKGFAEDGEFVDLIFSSGNGVCEVDDLWLSRAREERVLGVPAKIAPPEEMIWSKSFVMERERYDGADVQHLLRACARSLDWRFLLGRMREHPEVLLSHLLLFRFSYPGERDAVPGWLLDELLLLARRPAREEEQAMCRGTLLSAVQYDVDLEKGLTDCRPLEVPVWKAIRGGGQGP
jgi:hypothetical protein